MDCFQSLILVRIWQLTKIINMHAAAQINAMDYDGADTVWFTVLFLYIVLNIDHQH